MFAIDPDNDERIVMTYWPEDDVFTDEDGYAIYNIYEFLTAGDVRIFMSDPSRFCMFAHRDYINHPKTYIDILYDYEEYRMSKMLY